MPLREHDTTTSAETSSETGVEAQSNGCVAGAFLAGRMLIAMPGIDDPRFERAVILLCVHSAEHAMGIAVNKPVEGLLMPDLFQRLGVAGSAALPACPVLSGGPVERERGFVVHTDDYQAADSTIPVDHGLALTATREVLEAMADDLRQPRRAVLALGCASWSPGQLEREIRDNIWLSCEPDESLIFDVDHEAKWSRALAKIGVRVEQLSMQAGRA